MTDESARNNDEPQRVAEATELLERKGIPAGAREFRLRQEFFRHGWDVRIREEAGVWLARAVKAGRPEVATEGTTEGNAVRLALAAALAADEAAETP